MLADLSIPPALYFRCAVEDRDPVYSVEPVPILVFGARCFSWVWSLISDRTWTTPCCWTRGPELWTSFHLIQITSCFPRQAAPRSTKPVRSRSRETPFRVIPAHHHRGLVPALETGPSNEGCCPRNNDHCPLERIQTPVPQNAPS